MRRGYDYAEYKQESHFMQENYCSSYWNTTYPSNEQTQYYVPPPTLQKTVHQNKPPSTFYHEPSDDEDDHPHGHHIEAINDVYDHNRRWGHRDHDDGNHGRYGPHHGYGGNNHAESKNKHRGTLLRPPTHQYHHPRVNDHGKKVEDQNDWRYGDAAPRVNYNKNRGMEDHGKKVEDQNDWRYGEAAPRVNYNKNRGMQDHYPRKYVPSNNYGEVSRVEDDYLGNNAGIGGQLESLIKGLSGKVKKIELIEYERTTYKGGRQSEWKVVGPNDDPTNYPTNGHHYYGSYPKSNAPRVKGF